MEKLIQFLIDWISLFQFWVVIDVTERAYRYQFGKPIQYLEPGLHFMWPFNIDECITTSIQEEWASVPVQSLTTSDGVQVTVEGTFRHHVIADSEKIKTHQVELGDEDEVTMNAFGAAIAYVVRASTLKTLHQTGVSEGVILDAARGFLNRYGYKISEFEWIQDASGKPIRLIQG
jgi:regulator of protease activity HflC (stomatin/prohibitin superfamily)